MWLNAASVLRYPAGFGETREVFLEEGEGFFQVKRDTTAPFTVHSSHLDTRVLGTSFRVKAYKDLSHEIVTVVSGKVAVSRGAEPLALLEKDQEMIFDKNTGNQKEILAEATESVDWKSGNVILKSVRFEDLILAVENAYQVSINFDRQKFKDCETLNATSGQPIWRKQIPTVRVRESIGLSSDSSLVFCKNNGWRHLRRLHQSRFHGTELESEIEITLRNLPNALVETNNILYVPSNSGMVCAIDQSSGGTIWKHKISNGLVSGITPITKRKVLVTNMDGKIALLKTR